MVNAQLSANVRETYGEHMTYFNFQRYEQRHLKSPSDVRLIDSVYRNRDVGMARKGLKILDKHWEEDETLQWVMNA